MLYTQDKKIKFKLSIKKMFGFFKKTLFSNDEIFSGHTDVHCHILPGVDDGIQKMEYCLQSLDYYEKHGLRRIFFTPHIAQSLHENTPTNLRARLEEVKKNYTGKIELRLGAEYMLDSGFDELLDKKAELLCASPGTILVETTSIQPPMDFDEIIYELQQNGLNVMLAHPERYHYMHRSDYEDLKRRDIRLQLNILSLAGIYGSHVQEKARWLLENDMYDFCGSDWHDVKFHTQHYESKDFTSSDLKGLEKLLQKNDELA